MRSLLSNFQRSLISIFLFSTTLISIAGCGRSDCISEHHEEFYIKQSGFPIKTVVSFCKAGRDPGKRDVELHVDSRYGFYAETNDRASRYDGSCSDGNRAKWDSVPIALTSASFGKFKLCYTSVYKTSILLLASSEECPEDTVAQKAPVDDCTKTMEQE